MAAFNAVAGLNPFTISAVAIRQQLLATGISTGKFIFGQAWNAITAWGAAVGWSQRGVF